MAPQVPLELVLLRAQGPELQPRPGEHAGDGLGRREGWHVGESTPLAGWLAGVCFSPQTNTSVDVIVRVRLRKTLPRAMSAPRPSA